jgi:hypothetical protein
MNTSETAIASSPKRKLSRARSGAGVGQLSLVEHALCPLDPRASLRKNLVYETSYFFTDSARHQQEAKATVFSPLGLSAVLSATTMHSRGQLQQAFRGGVDFLRGRCRGQYGR